MRISDWSSDVCSSDLAGNDEATRAVRSHGLAGKVRVLKQGNPDDPAARFLSVALNSPAIAFPESGSDPEFDRRTKVLMIADKSFLKKGYSATSIDEIAEAAGTTGPALYRLCTRKHEIPEQLCPTGRE